MKYFLVIIITCLFSSTSFAKTLVCIDEGKEISIKLKLVGGDKWCKVYRSKASKTCGSGKNSDTIRIYNNVPLGKITTTINRYTGRFTEDWKFKEKFADGSDTANFRGTCTLNKQKKF
jgi:hypothetical protein